MSYRSRGKKRTGGNAKQATNKKVKTGMSIEEALHALNPDYMDAEVAGKIQVGYNDAKPFKYAYLHDFVDAKLLQAVQDELLGDEWVERVNDLYSFAQTDDMKNTKKDALSQLRKIIYSDQFLGFLKNVTGIELNHEVDISGSRYWSGSQLLCHDDELEGRRIAFILYIVPEDWEEKDGGQLDLFEVDSDGQPVRIGETVWPKRNSFIFFEVSPVSWHQVAEILSLEKHRMSISGWLHGPPIVRPPPFHEVVPLRKPMIEGGETLVAKFINPEFLKAETWKTLQEMFEQESILEMNDFMIPSVYDALEAALQEDGVDWKQRGPYNRRNYSALAVDDLEEGSIIKQAANLFTSQAFATLLNKLTELEVVSWDGELRNFKHTNYTLCHDKEHQIQDFALDTYFFVCPRDEWDSDVGGFICYVVEDEEEELFSIQPQRNQLVMVCRDKGCMRFVKYVNWEAPGQRQDFANVYWETK